jgi:hypothetical protein
MPVETLSPSLVFFQQLIDLSGYSHIRPLPGGRHYAAISRFAYTTAIVTGRIGDLISIDDRWCYHDKAKAIAALDAWDGSGEPAGWHRHPGTGRRIAETDREYDGEGRIVPIGALYVRR